MTPRYDRNEFQQAFGRRLNSVRVGKNLSQTQLAERVGYHMQTISNLERGLTCPSLHCVFLLAEMLDVSPKDLLFGEEKQNG